MYKILVVDNDKLIRWSLKELFTQERYEVDEAASTADALQLAENNRYDLIFADYEINEENWIEMIRKTKEIQPSAQIVILSARSEQQIKHFLGPLNIFSIIEKPFQADQIKAVAKEALNLQRKELT